MAFRPAAQFDPGIIERGFANVGNAIAGGIQNYTALKKQDKAAKAIYDALEPEADEATGALRAHPLGMNRDAFNSLSAPDRIAKIAGFVEAEAVKSARRREQREAQEMALRGRELTLREQQAALQLDDRAGQRQADNALARALQASRTPAVATPGPFGGPVAPGGVSVDRLLEALAENPQAVNARGLANVDNLIRAIDGGKAPKSLSFVNSPTGATIALSPDTGAFQYDPFSKAQAQSSQLQPRDALKAYNDNQERLSKLMQNRKRAENPEFKDLFDAEALDAEIEALQAQQEELRTQAGFKKPATRTGTAPAAAAKVRKYNPATGRIE